MTTCAEILEHRRTKKKLDELVFKFDAVRHLWKELLDVLEAQKAFNEYTDSWRELQAKAENLKHLIDSNLEREDYYGI